MYEQRITRTHRTAIILVVDCSTSMQEITTINNLVMSKSEAIAFACNYLIDELLLRNNPEHLRSYKP